MSGLCRDCRGSVPEGARRCTACRSPRVRHHPELTTLAIAHLDCDAFYAAVEKRDNPALADRPVIIGGGRRGVVATACYVARTYGVRSAMPMFKALAACPDAVVIRPDMRKYADVSRAVRARMERLTPLVQPLSLDEAFLDLSGTERLHGASPAAMMMQLATDIERDLGISVSIGLSYNKFLAKIASDLDKPRGFAVIGRQEAVAFLKDRPVSLLPGVGKVLARQLMAGGLATIGDVQGRPERELVRRFGEMGLALARFARGEDPRSVTPREAAKSISAETTFERDIHTRPHLEDILWRLAERVAARAKAAGQGGITLTLKLKHADFRSETRRRTLTRPTQLADVMFRQARMLLEAEPPGTAYRLIGLGLSGLVPAASCDLPDLLDPAGAKRARAERAMDAVRGKFGAGAIAKGPPRRS